MKILDCTLRDGGYYTNWDFDRKLVDTYIQSCNDLPIDYLEVGYRSIPLSGYHGEYFYLPLYVLQRLKAQTRKKLVIILDEKDIRSEHVYTLLSPCIGLVDMIRLAIDPKNFSRALTLAESIKKLGFKIGFNVMYMSKWKSQNDFLQLLPELSGIADYLYMVDSYGGVYPEDVKSTIKLVKCFISDVPLGFHGHNNMELALINTLTAINEGCEIVDVTITGMGRGAGNLKTELLLTSLNAQGILDIDFNPLSKVVDMFTELQKKHEWGTNLPYMVSGAHSLPQKDVMDWVGKRFYSFNSIILALQNQAKGLKDNIKINKWVPTLSLKKVLIVGGGASVLLCKDAIKTLLDNDREITVIHASSKNALVFKSVLNKQIFCLVGNEGHRMEEIIGDDLPTDILCVLPPSPRKMGTYIPSSLINNSVELDFNLFTDKYIDSHCSIALQIAASLRSNQISLIGFDGYSKTIMDEKAQDLFLENSYLFKRFQEMTNIDLYSLTETTYPIKVSSIYSLI
jgi:4-hydroxy 2-oxovalerate aldolase